jgi:hypothetical protein
MHNSAFDPDFRAPLLRFPGVSVATILRGHADAKCLEQVRYVVAIGLQIEPLNQVL